VTANRKRTAEQLSNVIFASYRKANLAMSNLEGCRRIPGLTKVRIESRPGTKIRATWRRPMALPGITAAVMNVERGRSNPPYEFFKSGVALRGRQHQRAVDAAWREALTKS
jgi:hypothetical protein